VKARPYSFRGTYLKINQIKINESEKMNGATWDNKCIERFKKKETKTEKKFNYDGRGMITHTHTHIIKKFQGILHVYPLLLLV
jgi:hypothetical protein